MIAGPTGRARPRRERAKMAAIRGMWTAVSIGIAFAVDYAADIDRLREFGLPAVGAIAVGAGLYAAKKYFWPDTTF